MQPHGSFCHEVEVISTGPCKYMHLESEFTFQRLRLHIHIHRRWKAFGAKPSPKSELILRDIGVASLS
jgi:hypothetical protein